MDPGVIERTLNPFILSLQVPPAFPAPDPYMLWWPTTRTSHLLRTQEGEGPVTPRSEVPDPEDSGRTLPVKNPD